MAKTMTPNGETSQLPVAPTVLRSELDRFAERYGLTAREYDILFLLVSGYSSVSMIAERLELSRNTVHNHFKNVFRRTRTNSKAGALALFIRSALGNHSDVQPFIRRPRVLVVEPDSYASMPLVEALQRRGMQVYVERNGVRLIERISDLRIDAVVADAQLKIEGETDLLTAVRDHYGKHPTVLLTTAEPGQSATDYTARGAGGLFERPVSADRLAFAILEHVVDSPYERNRLARIETDLRARVNRSTGARVTNLGFGGAFVAVSPEELDSLDKNSPVELEVELDSDTSVTVRGEIIWRSSRHRPSLPSGVGIKFIDVSEHERSQVEEYVRKHKLADLSASSAHAQVGLHSGVAL